MLRGFSEAALGPPDGWTVPAGYPDGLALCVIDAIWSLGAHYDNHVVPVVERYRDLSRAAGREPRTDTPRDLLATVQEQGGPSAFAEALANRQRTSTHPGAPRKAEVVAKAATMLSRLDVLTPGDLLASATVGGAVKSEWRQLPGQRSSGVGWRYLLLLAGSQEVKADRMVCRYVSAALEVPAVGADDAEWLMTQAAADMKVELRMLDHAVWNYQRIRQRGR
jgi:hypothetical protein